MLNYGFALENNIYDTYMIYVNLALTQIKDFKLPILAKNLKENDDQDCIFS